MVWTPHRRPLCGRMGSLGAIEEDASMDEITKVGLDLAKNVFVRAASRMSFCFTGGDIA